MILKCWNADLPALFPTFHSARSVELNHAKLRTVAKVPRHKLFADVEIINPRFAFAVAADVVGQTVKCDHAILSHADAKMFLGWLRLANDALTRTASGRENDYRQNDDTDYLGVRARGTYLSLPSVSRMALKFGRSFGVGVCSLY